MLLFLRQMFMMLVCVRVVHLYCSAQWSMFNMEKHYRNKIIIIIIIIIYSSYKGSRILSSEMIFSMILFCQQVSKVDCGYLQMGTSVCIASVSVQLYDQWLKVSIVKDFEAKVTVNGVDKTGQLPATVSTGGCEISAEKSDLFTYTISIPQMNMLLSVRVGEFLSVSMIINSTVSS